MSEARSSGTGPGRAAANGTANGAAGQALPSDPAALERLIDVRRQSLAATVDQLALRAQPKEIARRGAQDASARLRAAVLTADGRVRAERVGAVVAAVVTLIALVVWRRRSR